MLIPADSLQAGSAVPEASLTAGTPVTVSNEQVGTVLVVGNPPPLGPLEQSYLNRTKLGLLYAALGACALALLLGIVLARALTRPIRALTTAIRAMAGGSSNRT